MTKIADTKQLAKIFGDAIVFCSDLQTKYVINAKAAYGGTLQHGESMDTILESFGPNETFITFLITHDESDDTMTEVDANNNMTTYDSFINSIMIYGENCDIVCASLYARLLTQEILANLHLKGVHIQTIENKGDATDFLNGRLVKRRDLIVHFACEIDTTKKESYGDITSADVHVVRLDVSR